MRVVVGAKRAVAPLNSVDMFVALVRLKVETVYFNWVLLCRLLQSRIDRWDPAGVIKMEFALK